MVYCVGLTGDIASGKTTVAELFSELGVEVIHADKISREITKKIKPHIEELLRIMVLKFLKKMGNWIVTN